MPARSATSRSTPRGTSVNAAAAAASRPRPRPRGSSGTSGRLTKRTDVTESRQVYLLAKEGDPSALASFRNLAYWLGIGLGIVINLLNPEKILIGGGVVSAGNILLGPVVEEARRRSNPLSFSGCRIERAALGNRAGLVGAAAWARHGAGNRG